MSLYSPAEATPYVSYAIESRSPAADGTARLRVKITQRAQPVTQNRAAPMSTQGSTAEQDTTTFVEELQIGEGTNYLGDALPAVVLSAARDTLPAHTKGTAK